MSDDFLTTLQTKTPKEGRELAILLSRKAIAAIQPSEEVRRKLRDNYANDTQQLIQSSLVIAIEFQTIAKANNYWKKANS
jgi:hypothetical protein